MSPAVVRIAATVLCAIAAIMAVLRMLPPETTPLARGHHQQELREMLATEGVQDAPGQALVKMRPVMKEIFKERPISSAPLYTYALLAGAEGDEALDESLRRNPRILPARMLRARRFLEEKRFDDTAYELVTLIRIDRTRIGDYLAALVEIANFEEGKAAVLKQLEGEPWWSDRLMALLNAQSSDLQFLYRANELNPSARPDFMERLTREKAYDLALIAWLDFNDVDLDDVTWPYNSSFEERDALPPFNWDIEKNVAEILPEGGLYVVHTARENTVFASQITVLGPGAYTLAATAKGHMVRSSGDIEIRISCTDSGETIARRSLGSSAEGALDTAQQFDVPPSSCPFQRIEIVGTVGQFPRVSRIEISELTVEPVVIASGEG